MAAYLTVDDCKGHLRDAFARLYSLPADQVELDGDIARAEALVHSDVGKRYVVPVTAPAEAITICKALALDLFAEHAYETRASGSEIPKKIREAGDNAREKLRDLARGHSSLAGAKAPEDQDAGAAVLIAPTAKPEFTRHDLEGF